MQVTSLAAAASAGRSGFDAEAEMAAVKAAAGLLLDQEFPPRERSFANSGPRPGLDHGSPGSPKKEGVSRRNKDGTVQGSLTHNARKMNIYEQTNAANNLPGGKTDSA